MARYVKRTNNYHRQLTSKKESRRKSQPKKAKELKSITIEFRSQKHKELFYPFMNRVLNQKGLDEYFTKCIWAGNTIRLSTNSKKYVGEEYMSLAVEVAESINQYEHFGNELPIDDVIYGYIKLYTRKGRQHLYIGIDYCETKAYNLLPGEGHWYGISEYEEVYSTEEFDDEYYDEW